MPRRLPRASKPTSGMSTRSSRQGLTCQRGSGRGSRMPYLLVVQRWRAQALEVHLIGWPAAQYRQVAVLAQFAGALHEQMRIDLAVVGQVEGDMPAAAEQRMMYQLAQQLFTGGALFVGSQGASGLPQLATQQNTRVAH